MRAHVSRLAVLTTLLVCVAVPAFAQAPGALRAPDVMYVPTPQEVVDAMLRMADVTAADVVYDLGSGDGRIPITAAQTFGATGVGIELNAGPDQGSERERGPGPAWATRSGSCTRICSKRISAPPR